jgi:hypothetical protein
MNRVSLVLIALCSAVTSAYGQELPFVNRSIKEMEAWVREDTNDSQRLYYLALAPLRFDHLRGDAEQRLARLKKP